jgi:hypothetical protein
MASDWLPRSDYWDSLQPLQTLFHQECLSEVTVRNRQDPLKTTSKKEHLVYTYVTMKHCTLQISRDCPIVY